MDCTGIYYLNSDEFLIGILLYKMSYVHVIALQRITSKLVKIIQSL